MRPRVAQRDHSTQALGTFVNQLQSAIPQLDSDLAKVQKAVTKTVQEAKPTKEEVKTAEDMLKKSENAYNLFGERMQQSRGKAQKARRQEEGDL
ncbi:hypothetical protein T484DRAFT_1864662 [Baffinella frigidus]|nr:hypothetical protein T484DRAFT_1864662 [Cryptophyta sp. CCMP2293]